MVNVAQLVRALVCGTRGRGFEPHLSPSIEDDQYFRLSSFLLSVLFLFLSRQKLLSALNVYDVENYIVT